MNIFNKTALQSMKKNRTRTLVTVVGVILSTAMITAVAAFGTSLLQFLVDGSTAKYGNWHAAFLDVDSDFAMERTLDGGVADTAVFEQVGYARLEGGKSPEKPYLFIAGFTDKAFDTLPLTIISGRLPVNSGEILVPSHVAAKGGVRFRVGDTLSLSVGNRMDGSRYLGQHDPYVTGDAKEVFVPVMEKTYTVVGICERPGFEEHSAPGYTLITRADTPNEAARFSVFAALKKPRKAVTYAADVARTYAVGTDGSLTYMFNDNVLRFMGASENQLFNTLMVTVGGILLAIIMTGSILLIYNSFNISLSERTRQFGILSSVGATSRQLRNSVLFEGLCIGAAGIPIGILTGLGSMGLVIPVVDGNFKNMLSTSVPLTLSVSAPAIAAAAAVSLVTILISAYLPAWKAANTPVMENIRQTNQVKIEAKDVKTSPFVHRLYGLEGALALKNFRRNRKRYRSIVLSLVLSVVLFVSGNAFSSTLKRLLEEYVVDIDYDILFYTAYMEDGEMFPLYEKLKTAGGVYDNTYQAVFSYICNAGIGDFSDRYREYAGYSRAELAGTDLSGTELAGTEFASTDFAGTEETVSLPLKIQFIEDSIYQNFINELGLPLEEYIGADGKLIAVALQRLHPGEGQEDKSAEGFGNMLQVFAEPSMTLHVTPQVDGALLSEYEEDIQVTFVNTYPVDPPPAKQISDTNQYPSVFMVVAPYSLKGNFETPGIDGTTGLGFLTNSPLQSVSDMETTLQGDSFTADYTLYNIYEVLEQFHNIIFVIDVFTYVFVIMISLIAVANVFNTISTNIRLRRRELAMLRSVGMSDRDFHKMMNFECLFYGMRTLLIGLPTAGLLSWLIYKGLVSVERMDNFNYQFPWGSMAVSVFGVLIIVFITMVYAVSRIKRENIIDALRDDMT